MDQHSLDGFPQILPRKCGGWLAISARESDLQIGVTAETEVAAKEKFKASAARCREILASDPATPK